MNSAAQAIVDPPRLLKTGRLAAVFLSLSLLAASSFAQTPVPAASNLHQWGAITLFHGLPSDRVRAIAQTPDGTLWFGTDNGLARYDGRRVQKVGATSCEAGVVSADFGYSVQKGDEVAYELLREGRSRTRTGRP